MKKMNIREFMEFGFLQEANRVFFHPLGLALEVTIDDETGECYLSAVQDYRDDCTELIFDELDWDKAMRVFELWREKSKRRKKKLGCVFQSVEGERA